jgi:hypothetical protein
MGKVKVYVRMRPSEEKSAVFQKSNTSITVEDRSLYAGAPIVTDFECDGVIPESDSVAKAVQTHLAPGRGDVLLIGYGHSGSGKTFSVFGPEGVLEAASAVFFNQRPHVAFLDVSFLEVYNDKVYDLLVDQIVSLQVLEDADRRIRVKNISRVRVQNEEQLHAVVGVGMQQRVVAGNAIHSNSSRSHAILQLTRPSGESVWLCDLAGSERIKTTALRPKDTENRELNSIHKSLHALRRCIMALRGQGYVPARSSVLTRLLFSSSHIAQCVLIACVSPDQGCVQETLSTLDFAASGLGVKAWGSVPKPPQSVARSIEWETQMLRDALQKVSLELEKEKARRIELENEIIRNSIASSQDTKSRVEPSSRLAALSREIADDSPPLLIDSSNESNVFPETTPKPSPLASPSLIESPSKPESSINESVLSQTWRHNQYDAILKKCWIST